MGRVEDELRENRRASDLLDLAAVHMERGGQDKKLVRLVHGLAEKIRPAVEQPLPDNVIQFRPWRG